MRSTIANQNESEVTKCVNASKEVFRTINDKIKDYGDWLSTADLKMVDTYVYYEDGKIYFKQPFVNLDLSEPNIIARSILKLEYGGYGLDASPDNFLGDGMLVDLYPFLTDQRRILELQFDYPYNEVRKRYFNMFSVLATYVIRLYKTNSEKSFELMSEHINPLLRGVETQEILQRECCRLLNILELGVGGEVRFGKFYADTKQGCMFSERDRKELLLRLNSFRY